MVFQWSLSEQVSSSLRILAVLSNAVVWIVSTRSPTSNIIIIIIIWKIAQSARAEEYTDCFSAEG